MINSPATYEATNLRIRRRKARCHCSWRGSGSRTSTSRFSTEDPLIFRGRGSRQASSQKVQRQKVGLNMRDVIKILQKWNCYSAPSFDRAAHATSLNGGGLVNFYSRAWGGIKGASAGKCCEMAEFVRGCWAYLRSILENELVCLDFRCHWPKARPSFKRKRLQQSRRAIERAEGLLTISQLCRNYFEKNLTCMKRYNIAGRREEILFRRCLVIIFFPLKSLQRLVSVPAPSVFDWFGFYINDESIIRVEYIV